MRYSSALSTVSASVILALASGLAGCDGAPDERVDPDVPAADVDTLARGNTAFAVDLLHRVGGDHDNLFFSPYSISAALGMTSAGAAGDTLDAIADTMRFELGQDALHPAFNRVDRDLASRAEVGGDDTRPFQLNVVNALWGAEDMTIEQGFLDLLAAHYGAGLRLLDFYGDPDGSRDVINDWVEAQTGDRIQNLLPEGSVTPDTRMVLTNAIYFNASWATPFTEGATADAPFAVPGAGPVPVPTMVQTAPLGLAAGDGWQAIDLPYDGHQVSMSIIMPDDYPAFEAGLTAGQLDAIIAALRPAGEVNLFLPRFGFETDLPLTRPLQSMGMAIAFGGGADFSRMSPEPLQITDVLHKAFIGIDEAGTEAAAATAVIVGRDSAVGGDPRVVRVDRPFLFVIRDRPTGLVLFLGRVLDPR